MVIWKSNWEKDGTTIFFKCGDYFGDHGHFDQGHLDIFRRAPLLIDSGSYLTFSGTFRMDYWRKTVAHNSILITEPGQADEGGQRVFHSQEDPTIQSYLANEQSETGEILEYETKERVAYVAGEFSAAYPADRVDQVTRELAFVDDRFLLVRDRITVGRSGLSPRILWHCPVQPVFAQDRKGFTVSRKGARATVQVLLPDESRLDWIDGFQVAGQQIRPEGHLKGLDDMGVGRVEVAAQENGSRTFEFLHLIDIADSNISEVPVSVHQDRETIRVKIGGSLVILGPDCSIPQLLGAED
jgi:heparin/heparan-sulfate lyase